MSERHKYLVEATAEVAQLDKEHSFVYREIDPDYLAKLTDDERLCFIKTLPVSFTIEVTAESVSDAEKIAHNSLDPLFEFDVHQIRRL